MDPFGEELMDLVLVYLKAKSKLWLEIQLLKERAEQENKRPHVVIMISREGGLLDKAMGSLNQ